MVRLRLDSKVGSIFWVSVWAILLSSCKVYSPQPASIPLFSSKGEIQISGGINAPPGLSGSIAYSPLNHFAFQLHGSLSPQNSSYSQGLLGYYWKNNSSNLELFSGYAVGKGTAVKVAGTPEINGTYSMYLLQFDIGQKMTGLKWLDYGFGIKTGILSIQAVDHGYYEKMEIDPIDYTNKYFLIEPIAFIKVGEGKLRLGLQFNGAYLINVVPNKHPIPYNSMSIGLNLNYRITKRVFSD